MRTGTIIVALIAIVSGCASQPDEPAAAPSPAAETQQPSAALAAAASEEDKLVCRAEETTGSRLNRSKKVCRYQSDLDAEARDATRTMRDTDRRSATQDQKMGTGN